MNWAQIILTALIAFGLLDEIMNDGTERVKKYDATKGIMATIIHLTLLNWGGFFDCWFK